MRWERGHFAAKRPRHSTCLGVGPMKPVSAWGPPLLAIAFLTCSSPAYAEEDEGAEPAEPAADARAPGPGSTRTRWYGWQTLIVDLGGMMAYSAWFTAAGEGDARTNANNVMGPIWYGAYALGAPIVHAAHGHWGRAAGSLAMRTAGVAAVALVGMGIGSLASGGDSDGAAAGLAVGVLAGVVTPIVIDAAVLSREKVRVQSGEAKVVPTVGPMPGGGAIVGAVATF